MTVVAATIIYMTVAEAETAARRLLESWWRSPDQDEPLPVSPRALAEGLGIEVTETYLPSDESGNIVISNVGPTVISLNWMDGANRQRFTCAHEIGHYIHRTSNPRAMGDGEARTFVDRRATLAGLGVDPDEIWANQFASALLMPAHLVKRFYLDERMTVGDLARRFQTSEQAMNVRLRNLRLA